MNASRVALIILFGAFVSACNGRDRGSASAQAVGDTIGAARRAAVMPLQSSPYVESVVQDGGRVTGTVDFTGPASADTAIVVPPDQNGCGEPLTIQRLVRHGGHVSGVVVWLTDVRQGRALSADRRYELSNNDCAWSETVQGVLRGGTLNVANYDPLAERAFVTDVSTGDTVAVAPFTDNGQVIPYDKLLRKTGLYEFSVESRPMSRAWVAVFDQPYFAVTDANGAFTIEGVPPGVHKIRAWHPMLGLIDTTVTVPASGSVTATLRFTSAPK